MATHHPQESTTSMDEPELCSTDSECSPSPNNLDFDTNDRGVYDGNSESELEESVVAVECTDPDFTSVSRKFLLSSDENSLDDAQKYACRDQHRFDKVTVTTTRTTHVPEQERAFVRSGMTTKSTVTKQSQNVIGEQRVAAQQWSVDGGSLLNERTLIERAPETYFVEEIHRMEKSRSALRPLKQIDSMTMKSVTQVSRPTVVVQQVTSPVTHIVQEKIVTTTAQRQNDREKLITESTQQRQSEKQDSRVVSATVQRQSDKQERLVTSTSAQRQNEKNVTHVWAPGKNTQMTDIEKRTIRVTRNPSVSSDISSTSTISITVAPVQRPAMEFGFQVGKGLIFEPPVIGIDFAGQHPATSFSTKALIYTCMEKISLSRRIRKSAPGRDIGLECDNISINNIGMTTFYRKAFGITSRGIPMSGPGVNIKTQCGAGKLCIVDA